VDETAKRQKVVSEVSLAIVLVLVLLFGFWQAAQQWLLGHFGYAMSAGLTVLMFGTFIRVAPGILKSLWIENKSGCHWFKSALTLILYGASLLFWMVVSAMMVWFVVKDAILKFVAN